MIDPGTFDSLPAAGAEKTFERGARGLGHTGPRIMLRQPDEDSVFGEGEAVTVHVEFLPAADGTAPDMATLKIKVRKGFFGRDITEAWSPTWKAPRFACRRWTSRATRGNFGSRFESRTTGTARARWSSA